LFVESGDSESVLPLAPQVLDSDACHSPSNLQRESRHLRFVDAVTSAK